ncbi:MAG TPA: DUF1292 domain-containing protein [Bacillota bacterium]|nr:DUF1292 domain-containing protein [Bacillota bacterium]HOL11257.1 DUF1292 domain-containing protein [Bacillota bacterium]HOQ02386.1 DUF1292 domain-containing protein [Bacillota bacterium]HPP60257.1 DUF1292 domain-containing protein [Bacillota bacterium]HPV12976.1 DUF1292 domain-containing protein [Bacillota bacterium]
MNKKDDRKPNETDDTEELMYDDLIVLTDEEGNEEVFRILIDDLFVEDRQYVVLMPLIEDLEAEAELVILRVESLEEGEATLVTISSDEEWEEILKAFEDLEFIGELEDYEIEIEEVEEEEPEDEEPQP